MAVSVATLVGRVGDRMVSLLAERTRRLVIGDGRQVEAEVGPIVSAAARDRTVSYINAGVSEGAQLIVDGREQSVAGHEGGYWLGGSLLDGVTPEMAIYREEIFGPVLSCVRVADLNQAIALVNSHEYGNGVSRSPSCSAGAIPLPTVPNSGQFPDKSFFQ